MKKDTAGKLYLIPCPIVVENTKTIPQETVEVAKSLKYFICEKIKTTRRYLRKLDREFDIDGSVFWEMDKRKGDDPSLAVVMAALQRGENVGLVSEAGCPCVADPGYKFVRKAHELDIKVRPLIGPSSILLALIASGLQGQEFTFHGYLPIKPPEIKKKIQGITRNAGTQICIETPYRNEKLFNALIENLPSSFDLCIAQNISAEDELIRTKSVNDWKKESIGELFKEKKPAIFVFAKRA